MIKTQERVNRFGLRENDMSTLLNILSRFPSIEKATLFGSRAKGTFRNGSDVDIAIEGDINLSTVASLSFLLNEETLMPYRFDIVNLSKTKHKALKAHVKRVGVVIYEK